MIMTVEISMYPVRDEYIEPIEAFIADLNGVEGLEVVTTPTSTRVLGDYDAVMDALRQCIAASAARYGTSVFVAKLLPGYEAR